MALPLPNLDDRRWTDLVEEGRALLPLHAPQWTDHNVHDPGITLIELLALIAEMDLYRVNRIPDEHRLKFLSLVGFAPYAPQGARGAVALRSAGGSAPIELPEGAELEALDRRGVSTTHRTLHPLTVVDAELAAVQSDTGEELIDLSGNHERGEPCSPFGSDPTPESAFYLGFRRALPPGVALSLYFDVPDSVDRESLARAERTANEVCAAPWGLLSCDPGPPEPAEDEEPEGCHRAGGHHSVRTVWEIGLGPGRWRELRGVIDETRALTGSGRVVLRAPVPAAPTRLGPIEDELYYLRCRPVMGTYEAAPSVLGPYPNAVASLQEVPARAVLWNLAAGASVSGPEPAPGEPTSFFPVFDGAGHVEQISFAVPGAPVFRVLDYSAPTASSPGRLEFEAVEAGTATGELSQEVELALPQVAGGDLSLFSLEADGWRAWTVRPSFDASRRADAHVRLDATRGRIVFGDGERGRVAPAGARILAMYDATAGAEGELAAGAPFELLASVSNRLVVPDLDGARQRLVEIRNPIPCRYGCSGETLEQASARAFDAARSTQRAVTLSDIEELALATPGVRPSRARAWANLHPAFPCYAAPGVITVVVLPFLPEARPLPSAQFLAQVRGHLARRRVLGSRLEIVGPTYVEVGIRARVRACAGVDPSALGALIEDALETFLHPVRGGADGTGWPFGRDLYRSEVLQVIDEARGADHVLWLELVDSEGRATCGNICIPPTSLVAGDHFEIEVL